MRKVIFGFVCAVIMIGSLAFASSAGAGSFCPAMGDIDSDGYISSADARLALRCSVGLERFDGEMLARGDADFDGRLTPADARLILRLSVGLEKGFAHTAEKLPGKAADCERAGLTEGKRCTVCGETLVKQENIPAKGHAEKTVSGKAADCENAGLTDGKLCTVCGKTLAEQKTVPAKGHVEETVPGKAADCENTGLTDGKVCSVCGKTLAEQENIPAKGHVEETVPGKSADCENAGLTDGKVCSVCGKTLTEQETVPAKGHSVVECDYKAPTMEEDGLTALKKCSVCQKVFEEQTAIPALKNLLGAASAPVEIDNAVNEDYPWVYAPEMSTDGTVVYKSSNRGVNNSASNLSLTVKGSGILCFELYVSSEKSFDGLDYGFTGPFTKKNEFSDTTFVSGDNGWQTVELTVNGETDNTVSTLYLGYVKDKSDAGGADLAAIKNIRWYSGEKTVTLGVSASEGGTLSGTLGGSDLAYGENTVRATDVVTLNASAKSGWEFLCYADENGDRVWHEPQYTFTVYDSVFLTAVFIRAGQYDASIGDRTYEKLSDALAAAKAGDTVYVLRNCALDASSEIKKGVVLVVPCMTYDKGYMDNGYNPDRLTGGNEATNGTLYRTLTVPEGVQLTVNGTLLVNAVTSRVGGGIPNGYGISGGYGKIALEGTIDVKAGALLDASGRIEGEGTVTLENGAKMYETYSIDHWRGGTFETFTQVNKLKNYPIFEYTMTTVRSRLVINSGASVIATVKMYAGTGQNYTRMPIIDKDVGLIRLSAGAVCVRTVVWDEELTQGSAANVTKGAYRDVYEFTGGASFASVSMNIAGLDLSSDKCKYVNVDGETTFLFKDGTYDFDKYFRFMPGAVLRAASGAVVNVKGGVMLTDNGFTVLDDLFWTGYTYPVGRADASLYIEDGAKLNVPAKGEITGRVTYENAADVNISDGAVKESSFRLAADPNNTGNPSAAFEINEYRLGLTLTEAEK